MAIRENVLGHKHPDTASSFCSVGSEYAKLGDHPRALQCEEKALAIATELFGARSPIKATVLKNIGFVHHLKQDLKKAFEFAHEALIMRRELFGDQHPETLTAVVDVAVVYCDSGRVHHGFQILDDYLKKISKNHPRYEWLKQQNRDLHSRYFLPGFRQLPKKRK